MLLITKLKRGLPLIWMIPLPLAQIVSLMQWPVQQFFGGPACIIDFGTATTFDAIDENTDYIGGAITPGIHVAEEALFQMTSKLPRVEIKIPPNVIGRNTVHAIQSGFIIWLCIFG